MMNKTILITGGLGFIGSHVVRLFVTKYPNYNILNVDCQTYAGNMDNLKDIEQYENYKHIKADITDISHLQEIFKEYEPNSIIHLAAESHVDRSIENPLNFVNTNVVGTVNLLNAYKDHVPAKDRTIFLHVSTDEVFGTLGKEGFFTENTPYSPNSPYSASKAASDHFVRAYGETFDIAYNITNCSNNYGPNQFPEKLIPLFIQNIINNKPLPVYGDGNYTRDWLYVLDHARGIDSVFHHGKRNRTYNIGGFNEWKNIDLIKLLCELMDKKLDRPEGSSLKLIEFVKDRPGHDFRYAIDASRINSELGWKPSLEFREGLGRTIEWYLENTIWLERIKDGKYKSEN